MAEIDFVEEIHIAKYWREQLGEYEYVGYNPDDLRRWYLALELRGPDEVRSYLIERTGRYPGGGAVIGIVATAPHPSLDIVEVWLKSHEGVRTAPYWTALGAFVLLVSLSMPYLHGCTTLQNTNHVATHPQTMSPPLLPGQTENGLPPPAATQPTTPIAPAAPPVATSPTTSSSTGASTAPR